MVSPPAFDLQGTDGPPPNLADLFLGLTHTRPCVNDLLLRLSNKNVHSNFVSKKEHLLRYGAARVLSCHLLEQPGARGICQWGLLCSASRTDWPQCADSSANKSTSRLKRVELAEVEIDRSRTDGVCSVSSFSTFSCFLLFLFLFLLFFIFFLFFFFFFLGCLGV